MHTVDRCLKLLGSLFLVFAAGTALAAPSLEVNGRTDAAAVSAPLPATVAWDVRDVDNANGIYLFVGKKKVTLQAQQGICATGGDDIFQNASGEPGTGYYDGKRTSTKVNLEAGSYFVLACALRKKDDGSIINKRGPTNIVAVTVRDTRPSGPGAGVAIEPEKALPDLMPVAVVVEGRVETKTPGIRLSAFGHGFNVDWPGSFDESGGTFRCKSARVMVYNGGGSASGRSDVRVRVQRSAGHATAETKPLDGIAPGQCKEVSFNLKDVPCSQVTAAVDHSGTVQEGNEGNNVIPPVPGRSPCNLKVKDHRKRQDHRDP